MLTYIPFEQVTSEHLRMLAKSLLACPEQFRPEPREMLDDLRAGRSRMFQFGNGVVVLGQRGNRLTIEAADTSAFRIPLLAKTLQRLAADWECDTIETTVFDSRLAAAILKVGSQVESWTLSLPVGTQHG